SVRMRSSGTPFMKFGLVSREAMGRRYIVVLGIHKRILGMRGSRTGSAVMKRLRTDARWREREAGSSPSASLRVKMTARKANAEAKAAGGLPKMAGIG